MSEADYRTQWIGKLRFRAWRRGFKEMDLILGPFSDDHLESLSDAELYDFERLLQVDDHVLYRCYLNSEELEDGKLHKMLSKIKELRV